jgi:hypothetical protein
MIFFSIFWILFSNMVKFFYYSFIHMCIHCLGHFSPLPSSPTLSPFPPQFQAGPVLPLSLVLLKKRDTHNKEDKVVFLVKDSYPEIFVALLSCTCFMTHVDSFLTDLYSGYWSHSHDNLCCFKVSVLAPLKWGHQMLSCFGLSTYFYITHMCSSLVMWFQSNHIAAFALDLKSTY